MQYLLLIYANEQLATSMSPAEGEQIFREYMEYSQSIEASGHMRGGAPLEPTSKATTVRVRDGKTVTTDGPFAETREQLGGYYLVEAADLDEAIKLAARIPDARYGCIEVRPVMPIPGM